MRQLKAVGFSVFVLLASLVWHATAIAAVKDREINDPSARDVKLASLPLQLTDNSRMQQELVRVAGNYSKGGSRGGGSRGGGGGGGGGAAIGIGIAVGIAAISAIQAEKEAKRKRKARQRRKDRARKARAKRKAQQAARKKRRDAQRRKAAANRKRELAKKRRLARERARRAREEQNKQEVAGSQPNDYGRPDDKGTPPENGNDNKRPGVSVGVVVPLVPLPGVGTNEPVTTPGRETQQPRRRARQQPQQRTTPTPPPSIVAANDQYWPREVVVEVDRFQPATADDAIAQDYSITRLSSDTNALIGSRFVHYRIPDSRTADTVIAALLNDNRILFAQRNNRYVVNQSYTKTAASSGLQYALAKIRLDGAHAVAQGRGVKVAVIDSGIDREHRDIKSGITAHFDAAPKQGLSVDAHGTAIAGIIRADGVAKGVAPEADILSVRAFYKVKGQNAAHSSTVILLRAMDWVAAKGANVVNMSFAGAKDPSVGRAIDKLLERKVHLVAAGGNNGPKAPAAYPAAYDGVIAVTATDTNDKLYTNANRGQYIELAAPGVDVFVVAPKGTHSFSTGTSMAAAHVSGLIALIIQQRRKIDQQAVRSILASTAIDLGKPGFDAEFGAGRVDASALIQAGVKTVAGK
ncbi:MAG: S8 family serine peptidase [Pseudomonadota bacterium]